MKKAFVTGGLGFIGSHLVDRLLQDEWRVVVLDNLHTGHRSNLGHQKGNPRLKVIEGDIRNLKTVSKGSRGCDAVFHFAAHALMRVSLHNHRADLEHNIIGTLNVLESMVANNIPDFVFASTSALYGEAEITPTPETYSGIQTSLYGAAKLAGEGYASAFAEFSPMKNSGFQVRNSPRRKMQKGGDLGLHTQASREPF